MKKMDLLFSLPLFSGTDTGKIEKMLEDGSASVHTFAVGEQIYSPQDRKKKLGVILSGSASVFSADPNNTVLLRMLEVGDTFGVATLFSSQDAFVSLIVAKKACRILILTEDAVRRLLNEDPVFSMNYIHFLSDRICFLNSKISCFTAGSPERKLAFFLLSHGNGQQEQYSLNINANALSDMLNIGRASLYRAFDSLVADGLILKEGKTITVPDKNALKIRFG